MATKKVTRQVRVPISGGRDILSLRGTEDLEKEFHLCWVNDYLVGKYQQAGYEFVYWTDLTEENDQVGESHINRDSPMESRVSKQVSNGVTGFLMKLPNELWEEDKKAHAQKVAETEVAMRRVDKQNGQYGSVTIE